VRAKYVMYSARYATVYVVLLPNYDRGLWWPYANLLRLIIPFLHTQWYGYECLSDQGLSIKRTRESLRLYLLCYQTGVFILRSVRRDVCLVGNTRLCHCSNWVIYLGGVICRKWIRYCIGNRGDLRNVCGIVGCHIMVPVNYSWDALIAVIYEKKQQSLVLCNQKSCLSDVIMPCNARKDYYGIMPSLWLIQLI